MEKIEEIADIIFPFRWFFSNNRDDALDLARQICQLIPDDFSVLRCNMEENSRLLTDLTFELLQKIGRDVGLDNDCADCHWRVGAICTYHKDSDIDTLTLCPQDTDFCKEQVSKVITQTASIVRAEEREMIIGKMEKDIEAGLALGAKNGDFKRPYYRTQSFLQALKSGRMPDEEEK